jgi:hypothetical protein
VDVLKKWELRWIRYYDRQTSIRERRVLGCYAMCGWQTVKKAWWEVPKMFAELMRVVVPSMK